MAEKPIAGVKEKGKAKTARIPIKIVPAQTKLKKPDWIRAKAPSGPEYVKVKELLKAQKMHTVCQEASCPNIGECFSNGTASFMIMGDICTRRCPFCDVAHGKPLPLDSEEPEHLANTVAALGLRYVVVTSVDRDDLRDGPLRRLHQKNARILPRNQDRDPHAGFSRPARRGLGDPRARPARRVEPQP